MDTQRDKIIKSLSSINPNKFEQETGIVLTIGVILTMTNSIIEYENRNQFCGINSSTKKHK